MDEALIKKYAVKFNRARQTLLAVAAFTYINLLLELFGADIYLIYSAYIPQAVFWFVAYDIGEFFTGTVLAFLLTSIYLVFWILSKRWRALILVALIWFIIDTVFLLFVASFSGVFIDFLIDIAFCIWISVSLMIGTHAWVKLIRVTSEEVSSAMQEITQEEQADEERSAMEAILPAQNDEAACEGNSDLGDEMYPEDEAYTEDESYHEDEAYTEDESYHEDETYPEVEQTSYAQAERSLPGTDDVLGQKVFAIYEQGPKMDSLHILNRIAPNLLENARDSYALSLGADERVILLYDATVGGSAKDGFVLTSKRLYSKNIGQSRNDFANISAINSVRIKVSMLATKIFAEMNLQKDIEINISETKRNAEALFDVLDKTLKLLKGQEM